MLEKLKNISALSNFGKKSSTMLGVDISTTAVKILQLSPSGNSYKVDNYIIRPLPANSVVEKNISDIDAVGDCIAQAISILKPSLKDAAVAVAGSAVWVAFFEKSRLQRKRRLPYLATFPILVECLNARRVRIVELSY